ncbi:MAG: hypothetical protein HQL53_01375 [Magnetococcales bacterium]|nr:hypothetical protein [Magnetococcales bacterium]
MVQVDLPAAFVVGQLFAALSSEYLRKEPRLFTNRLTGPVNLFMICFFVPVGILMIGWPTWEVMYITDWLEGPYNRPLAAGFYVLFGIVMVLLANVGFMLGHHWYREGRDKWVRNSIILGFGLTVLPFLLRWGVWLKVDMYQEMVVEGGGYPFWEAPFFSGWIVMMSSMVIGFVVMVRWLKKRAPLLEP